MSTGPLRRLVGSAGLLVLAPTAAMLVLGSITPVDAAIRAVATLAVTLFVGRLASWWLTATASSFERADTEDLPPAPVPAAPAAPAARAAPAAPEEPQAPRRRRTDRPATD